MNNKLYHLCLPLLAATLLAAPAYARIQSKPIIIDHTCTDYSKIPSRWVDSAKQNLRMHYAHTSFGEQLTVGLQRLQQVAPFYAVKIAFGSLPTDTGAVCIFDGQIGDDYIEPIEYWESEPGMDKTRNVLQSYPTINLSMWTWCSQLAGYTESDVRAYLDSLSRLEQEYPAVTFIYATGNCQWTSSNGLNTYRRNQQIRNYCIANNKVLFDFGDLDCWWFNPDTQQWEFSSYYYEGYGFAGQVPLQHPHYNGSQAGHSTFENCDNKGKAVWFMLAMLAGWSGNTAVTITSFTGGLDDDGVLLQWRANPDGVFEGYNLYRADAADGEFMKMNDALIYPGVAGEYVDRNAAAGHTYHYRLGAVERGEEYLSETITVVIPPKMFNLYQNYPNPFNPTTTIRFFLPSPERVGLAVYDSAGRRVRRLFDGERGSGEQSIVWDGADDLGTPVKSGVYYYRLTSGKDVQSRKMLLVR